jgi:hypothetical protein
LLGVVTIEPSEALVLNVPLDADAAAIVAAIKAANLARVEAQAHESRKLRELFLEDDSR